MFCVFLMVLSWVCMFGNPYGNILGATEGLTVDCKVTCVCEGFVFLGVVKFGRIGEILCCVVVVCTISSFMKCDGVWISC